MVGGWLLMVGSSVLVAWCVLFVVRCSLFVFFVRCSLFVELFLLLLVCGVVCVVACYFRFVVSCRLLCVVCCCCLFVVCWSFVVC